MALQAMAKQRLHEQVGLLVNGMIVIGELGDPEALAALLQVRRGAQIERAERPEGLTDAEWEEMAQDWISEPVRMVEDARAREAALDEALEPYLASPRGRADLGRIRRRLFTGPLTVVERLLAVDRWNDDLAELVGLCDRCWPEWRA